MNVYIAGKFLAKERLKVERERVSKLGFSVTSSWMDNPYMDEAVPKSVALDEAYIDIREVIDCDMLILDTLDESMTGGREVELGMVIGLKLAVPHSRKDVERRVFIVGPYRNVFHKLYKQFDSWDLFLEEVIKEKLIASFT